MTITELGAIGELVGGVAVIASLIYVGLQVRQSNRVARAESIRELAAESGQIFMKTCDPALTLTLRRAIRDFEALPKNEQSVVSGFLTGLFVCAQTVFTVRASRRPSKIEYHCASWIASPGITPWWRSAREAFNDSFVEQIERLASDKAAQTVDEIWPWFTLDEGEMQRA